MYAMSFGFSISDFVTLFELATRVRKRFIDAPDQFKAISDDVRGLSIAVQDAEIQSIQLSDAQRERLVEAAKACNDLLRELEKTLDKYSEIGNVGKSGVGKRLWKRLKWERDDIRDIRGRIISQVSLLNAISDQITARNVGKLVEHQEDQKRQDILEWVSTTDHSAQ